MHAITQSRVLNIYHACSIYIVWHQIHFRLPYSWSLHSATDIALLVLAPFPQSDSSLSQPLVFFDPDTRRLVSVYLEYCFRCFGITLGKPFRIWTNCAIATPPHLVHRILRTLPHFRTRLRGEPAILFPIVRANHRKMLIHFKVLACKKVLAFTKGSVAYGSLAFYRTYVYGRTVPIENRHLLQ
jgi:hypothetical protein